MRRVRYFEYGGPEVLRVEDVEIPTPGRGQLRLHTEVIAGSFVDTVMRRGAAPVGQQPLPGSPHGEVVGIVDAVGPDVPAEWVGARVAALAYADAYADQVLVAADSAALVPAGLSAADATVLAMAAPVSMVALTIGRVRPGGTVLVHAAAGSIGHLAVQLARVLGAGRIVGTSGSAAKSDYLRGLGADPVVLGDGWTDEVARLAPDGVDVVLDSLGGQTSAQSLALLAPFGTQVVYGAAGGALPDIPSGLLLGMRTVTGFGIVQWRTARPDKSRWILTALTGYLADGRLRPTVQATVPLDDAQRAHALLEDRSRIGRVLLTP
jgi:NADPH2:quinone reductase